MLRQEQGIWGTALYKGTLVGQEHEAPVKTQSQLCGRAGACLAEQRKGESRFEILQKPLM